jgi:hypothetical protein
VWVVGLLAGTWGLTFPSAQGQDPDPNTKGQRPAAPADLSARYHFVESYGTGGPKDLPRALTAYRAAFRETITVVADAPGGGAPERTNYVRQAIWTERPARISPIDSRRVEAVVRRYDRVRLALDAATLPSQPAPLRDVDIWVDPSPSGFPQVISLQQGRGLTMEEYRFLSMHIHVPDLAEVLPPVAIQLGDSWRLSRAAAGALVSGGVTGAGTLMAKLSEFQPGPDGKNVAIFTISGEVPTGLGEAAVSARAEFTFDIVPPDENRRPTFALGGSGPPPVEAHGAILRLSLAQEDRRVPVGDDPRRKQDLRREFVFERQLEGAGADPVVPAEPPVATPANSWLTYTDPKGQFQVLYPQDMILGSDLGPTTFVAQRRRPEGGDQVRINVVPGQPKPDDFSRDLAARWRESQIQAISSSQPQPLPEADWPDRKVYRTDALLWLPVSGPRGRTRVYFYGYVAQTGNKSGLTAEVMTSEDPPTAVRNEVEAILKSFRFGSPGSAPDAPPATAGP